MNAPTFDIRISTEEKLLVEVRDFSLPLNRMTVLFGESGIGKSLIARAIYGLLDPEEFHITINGESYESYLRRPVAKQLKENSFFVFQEPSSHLNPLLPLGVQLREGDLADAPGDLEILKELWDGQTIEELLEVYPKPYRPSGGEKQRLFLAMALKKFDMMAQREGADRPILFVFDEPTGSLDNHFRNVFLSLLFRRFQRHPYTTLLITHDYSIVAEITGKYRASLDRILFKELLLRDGRAEAKDFMPEVYLGWLDAQRTHPVPEPHSRQGAPLLKVESGAVVFGQQLEISRDRDGSEPSPLEIFPGSMVYLKAPSGTGKTTLVKMMMGLLRCDRLRLMVRGTALTEGTPRRFWQRRIWGREMAMTFQHADEALNPRSTVAETFQGLPAQQRITPESIRNTLGELFEDDITDEFMRRRVSALSGGQKQRLNLLRALFLQTDILILDEPLNGLDFESTKRVIANLRGKQQAGKGILIISHNEEIFDALIPEDEIYYLRRV